MESFYKVGDNLLALAPTIVFRHVWPEADAVNRELKALVDAMRDAGELYVRDHMNLARESSRYISRHSHQGREVWEDATADVPNNDFLGSDAPAVAALKAWILRAVDEIKGTDRMIGTRITSSWAQVYRSGDFIEPHTHWHARMVNQNVFWSGAYYVDDGRPSATQTYSGVLTFNVGGHIYHFKPRPGLMLMWPSHVQHHVNPFYGDGERIMVSWNMCLSQAEMVAAVREHVAGNAADQKLQLDRTKS